MTKSETQFQTDAMAWLASMFSIKNCSPSKCRLVTDGTYADYARHLSQLGYVNISADTRKKQAARNRIVASPTELGWDYVKLMDL